MPHPTFVVPPHPTFEVPPPSPPASEFPVRERSFLVGARWGGRVSNASKISWNTCAEVISGWGTTGVPSLSYTVTSQRQLHL